MSQSITARRDWRWLIWRTVWLLAAAWIVVQAVRVRLALPQWPLIAPDSFFYILPSVNDGFYNIGPRTFVYPMFCRILYSTTGDWRSLPAAQHMLGLLGPSLLLFAWCLLGARIWVSRVARASHEALGLALPLLLLPSAIYVTYEQQIVVESLNAFFQCALAALLCVLWLPMTPRRRLLLACLTASLGVFMYFANPRWGAAAPLVVALALLASFLGRDRSRSWFRSSWPVVACSAASYFSLGQVQSRLVPPDPWLETFTAKHLLWMHADLAINEFRRDLARNPPPVEAAMLKKFIAKIEAELVGIDVSRWKSLPFNANALLYVADCPDALLAEHFKNDPRGYRRYCLRYYARIVWHQPAAYFAKVRWMLGFYYNGPASDGAFREFAVDISEALPGCASVVRYTATLAAPAQRAGLEALAVEMEKKFPTPVIFRVPDWLNNTVTRIHPWFLRLSLLGVASAAVTLIWPRLRERRGPHTLAVLCLAATAVLFAQVLTLAMVTVTEGRYADALRSLAVFSLVTAVAATAVLLVESTLVAVRRLTSSSTN